MTFERGGRKPGPGKVAGALAALAALAAAKWPPAEVPTLEEAIGRSPNIVRVKVLEVPEEGPVRVEVREVYWGDFENKGWVDPTYEVPDAEGEGGHDVAFEFKVGEQYVIFGRRDFGGLYRPFLFWNTRWGVADVVEDELELARFAEGPRRIRLAAFRETVREVKWGM
ncbi:MAG: hypothetical protein GTN49_00870 [candidate division Zixibacteria bacterium]|nr:hypothetical protein [candidate division Zixibacteria bacterium]